MANGIRKIYKYKLQPIDPQLIYMPAGSQILSAQLQNGEICVWAVVDPAEPAEVPTCIRIACTGESLDYYASSHNFIGTLQNNGIVIHLFRGSTTTAWDLHLERQKNGGDLGEPEKEA